MNGVWHTWIDYDKVRSLYVKWIDINCDLKSAQKTALGVEIALSDQLRDRTDID